MILRAGEKVVDNPGGKRCKNCGGLILDAVIIRYGCNVRHARDKCLPQPRQPKRAAIKKTSRSQRKSLSYLREDA